MKLALSPGVLGSSMPNSSPPWREQMSDLRTCCCMTDATDLQDPVAGGVAVGVVEVLEVIDVEDHERERLLVAQAARELLLGAVHEEAPVVEAG